MVIVAQVEEREFYNLKREGDRGWRIDSNNGHLGTFEY